MKTKFFGQFLLEKGIINREQLLEALDEQRRSAPLLGDIAVEQGLITVKQSDKINAEQRRQDKRFGEIAIGLGLLTEAQIESLLSEQKSRRKYFGEILLSLGHISRELLDQKLTEHKQSSEAFSNAMEGQLDNNALPKQANVAHDVFMRFYQRMLKIATNVTSVDSELPPQNEDLHFWSQSIDALKPYRVVFAMDADHACLIATHFMGMDMKALDEISIDAVAEFLNTYVGHIYAHLDESETPSVNPPQHHGQQFPLSFSCCVRLVFDSGQFPIHVTIGVDKA